MRSRRVIPRCRTHLRLAATVLLSILSAAVSAQGNDDALLTAAGDWPLWAYGAIAPPQPGDTAVPQSAPGPRFRPDLTREEHRTKAMAETEIDALHRAQRLHEQSSADEENDR